MNQKLFIFFSLEGGFPSCMMHSFLILRTYYYLVYFFLEIWSTLQFISERAFSLNNIILFESEQNCWQYISIIRLQHTFSSKTTNKSVSAKIIQYFNSKFLTSLFKSNYLFLVFLQLLPALFDGLSKFFCV